MTRWPLSWRPTRCYTTIGARPEFFGLYGLAGKFSAVSGPIIWGVTLFLLEPLIGRDAYRFGVLAQLALMVAGVVVLRGVVEGRREIAVEVEPEPAVAG